MKIRVIGGTKWQRALAYGAARYTLSERLWISDYKKANSVLYIRIQKFDLGDPSYGIAYFNADSSYRAKSYTIQINSRVVRNKADFLETLMHELVHVWQMVNRGMLRYSSTKKDGSFSAFWRGVEHDPEKGYRSQPWESQAFRLEKKLVASYLANV